MKTNSILSQFNDSMIEFKLDKVVNQLAEKEGITGEEWVDKHTKHLFDEAIAGFPIGFAQELKSFRESVGEDVWSSISNNPDLKGLVKEYMDGLREQKTEALKKSFTKLFEGTELTVQEIHRYLKLNGIS